MLSKMISLAASAHDAQVDKGGVPYILHPLEVMRIVQTTFRTNDQELLMIAVGHDLIEDTRVNEYQLQRRSFSKRVIDGIVALSKDESKSFAVYKEQVFANQDALMVKYADLTHNLDLTRLPTITQNDLKRIQKYILFKSEIEERLINQGHSYLRHT